MSSRSSLPYRVALAFGCSRHRDAVGKAFLRAVVEETPAVDRAGLWLASPATESGEWQHLACAPDGTTAPARLPDVSTIRAHLANASVLPPSGLADAVDPAAVFPHAESTTVTAVRAGALGVVMLGHADGCDALPASVVEMLAPLADRLATVLRGCDASDPSDAPVPHAELRITSKRLSALLDNMRGGVLVENARRQVAYVNQAFCDLFGLEAPPEAVIGADCTAAAREMASAFADPSVLTTRVDAILDRGTPVSAEQCALADGRVLERDYVPIDLDGSMGHLWLYRDVTERAQTTRALLESEIRFRTMFEEHSAPMLLIDPDSGAIEGANRAAVDFYGYDAGALTQMTIQEINQLPPDEVAARRAEAKERDENRFVFPHRLASGTVRTVEVHSSPIDVQGEQLLFSIIQDVTARHDAQAKLRQSRRKFKALFETSHDAIFLHDRDGRILDANERATELFRVDRETLLSLTLPELHPPSVRDEVAPIIDRVADGESARFDIPFRRPDGTVFQAEVSSSPTRIDGQVVIQGIVRDVTERKEAENRLRQSEERWRRLVESHRDPIQITIDGIVRYVNPAGADIFGAETPEDLIGRSTLAFAVDETVRNRLRKRAERLKQGEPTPPLEHDIERLDGQQRRIVVYSVPIEYEGQPAAQTVIHDVTEQRKAEAEVRRLKNFYEQVLNAMPIDLAIFGTDGRYQYVNPSALSDPDLREQIVGMTDVEYATMRGHDVDDARMRLDTIRRVARTRETEHFDEAVEASDGTMRHFVRFVSPVVQDDEVVQVLGYGLEITEQKRVEKALREAKETAEDALAARERFVATMSHEMRTPLNAITGLVQLLEQTSDLGADDRYYLENIRHSADLLLSLVNDLLDFAKIQAGRLALDVAPFQPSEVADHVYRLMERKATDDGLTLTLDLAPSLPEVVRGDDVRTGQVLINLVSNAIKFTESGRVTIRGHRAEAPPPSPKAEAPDSYVWIVFEVEDTGPGIPPDDRERIFESFEQSGDRDVQKQGSGLGLAIVKEIVERMGGTITLDSTVGVGSTFTVCLPMEPARQAARPGASGVTPDGSDDLLQGARILVVDDNAMNRMVACDLLDSWGATTARAADGQEALDRLARDPFDLVLMDVQMPRMDGYEATRQIRNDDALADLPVVALTASVPREDQDVAFDAGMDAFVLKPFDSADLKTVIVRHLRAPATADSSASSPVSSGDVSPASPSAAPEDAAVVDLSFLHDNLGAPESVERYVDMFQSQADAFVHNLEAALDDDNAAERIATLAHKMTSPARMVGAQQLLRSLRALEHNPETATPEDVHTAAQRAREAQHALDRPSRSSS